VRIYCPEEFPISLYVNGEELATYQLTDQDLIDWTYGHLYTEGMIDSAEEVVSLQLAEGKIHVKLNESKDLQLLLKRQKHFTAGCGNGVTFFSMTDVKRFPKIETDTQYALSYLLKKRHEFAKKSTMYNETGGMHGACIIDEKGTVVVREDIGRHNAVDKIIGYVIRKNIDTSKLVLLTTGRVSYEMLAKAARCGFGIIGSRTAATKQAVQLANYLGIEVVGYMRGRNSIIYTNRRKVVNDLQAKTTASK